MVVVVEVACLAVSFLVWVGVEVACLAAFWVGVVVEVVEVEIHSHNRNL